jgi:hypothetical protein
MSPYLENAHYKKGLVEWLKVIGPKFKPPYWGEKKIHE